MPGIPIPIRFHWHLLRYLAVTTRTAQREPIPGIRRSTHFHLAILCRFVLIRFKLDLMVLTWVLIGFLSRLRIPGNPDAAGNP